MKKIINPTNLVLAWNQKKVYNQITQGEIYRLSFQLLN